MLPRTIFIRNSYHLSTSKAQIVLEPKEDGLRKGIVPIEDIGFLVLEHPNITISQACIAILSKHNVAVIFCSSNYLPTAMLMHLDTHSVQAERFRAQICASEPLRKQLWAQIVKAKLISQDDVLRFHDVQHGDLTALAKKVKSGDTGNLEAQGARRYWPRLLGPDFTRERGGTAPNGLLNYGYTILRAAVARSLCGSGLLPTLGIHHHNRYNHFALADDIMEPYRAFVDLEVKDLIRQGLMDVDPVTKQILLKLLVRDTFIGDGITNMSNAITITASSLAACFEGRSNKIMFPNIAKTLIASE